MLTEDWIAITVILVCLVASFFFSASETALTAFSHARMLRVENSGDRRARMVTRLAAVRERMIGAILTGSNVVNILASSLTTGLLLTWLGDGGVLDATATTSEGIVVC